MKSNGESKATTLPASIGLLVYITSVTQTMVVDEQDVFDLEVHRSMWRAYFAPVLATDREPPCLFAVTSQAMREHARPKTGEMVAAARFCLLHIKVNVAGTTADEIITPCHSLGLSLLRIR